MFTYPPAKISEGTEGRISVAVTCLALLGSRMAALPASEARPVLGDWLEAGREPELCPQMGKSKT